MRRNRKNFQFNKSLKGATMSETTEIKIYKIAGVEYRLKNHYSMKEWGQILKITATLNIKNRLQTLILLLAENKLEDLLNIILDKPLHQELYEEDFEEVSKVIYDFFSREQSLMKRSNQEPTNLTRE